MRNYIQAGQVITFTSTAPVLSGDLILIGDSTLAVSTGSYATGEAGEAILEGVVELKKTPGIHWTTGDKLGVDMTGSKLLTNVPGPNVRLIGRAFNTAIDADEVAAVKLDGAYGLL